MDINEEQLLSTTKKVAYSFQDFTPEQEYYIGRTVGVMILDQYSAYSNTEATAYLNLLGQTLAQASDLPETFSGYHFLILDSEDINAFAAPSGFIFVTRGMIHCCQNEDALAAVLAHEIGHVQNKHGLQAIKKSRISSALTELGIEGVKSYGGENLAKLTETFENSISDITTTLINNGYSRSFEKQADQAAVKILQRVGYSPQALIDMLKEMETRLKPEGKDFAKTHPAPQTRITEIEKNADLSQTVESLSSRQNRFDKALKGI
jgi:predicted Zn-dependent protease